jgi:hypothetical protein
MPISPKIRQNPEDIVSLEGWELDQEFPFGPQGAKPKRIVICPPHPPHSFLIGGHRYLFKEPTGARAMQIWSEVIAYEVARAAGVPVPPAFLAYGPGNGAPGVLVEFFYGHLGDPDSRLIDGIERLQALRRQTDFRRGSLKDNIDVCRLQMVPDWRFWWARTLAFDALIGNTDRHSQNWGFLATPGADGRPAFSMAPAFDNGTSLGFIVGESELVRFTRAERLRTFIHNGRHHYGWTFQRSSECSTYRTLPIVRATHQLDARTHATRAGGKGRTDRRDRFLVPPVQLCRTVHGGARTIYRSPVEGAQRCACQGARRVGMEHWIECPSQPTELILAWQAPTSVPDRTRWAIGKLIYRSSASTFEYFDKREFERLNLGRSISDLGRLGYAGYPAFDLKNATNVFKEGVLEAFVRRLPPRSRADFSRYLEHYRYRGGVDVSPMTLLAVTEAKLPSDGFSLIDQLDPMATACDVVFEIAGFRHYASAHLGLVEGAELALSPEPTNQFDPMAIRINANDATIGYVNRLQASAIANWLTNRAVACWLLRMNGTVERPKAYAFVRMRLNKQVLAA